MQHRSIHSVTRGRGTQLTPVTKIGEFNWDISMSRALRVNMTADVSFFIRSNIMLKYFGSQSDGTRENCVVRTFIIFIPHQT
jgi:hypothetical protein